MNHTESLQLMAAERYLLDELTADQRDAFEQHAFDCMECSLDLRAGAAFIHEAKVQLPQLTQTAPSAPPSVPARPKLIKKWWTMFWQPAFAAPVFATLLAIIAFQNLSTIPALRSAATEPRVAPWASVHTGTRGGAHTVVQADPSQGAVLLIDAPADSSFTSYDFELYDAANKLSWSHSLPVSADANAAAATLSLYLPPAKWRPGSYTLSFFGRTSSGERKLIDQRILDIRFDGTNPTR